MTHYGHILLLKRWFLGPTFLFRPKQYLNRSIRNFLFDQKMSFFKILKQIGVMIFEIWHFCNIEICKTPKTVQKKMIFFRLGVKFLFLVVHLCLIRVLNFEVFSLHVIAHFVLIIHICAKSKKYFKKRFIVFLFAYFSVFR